MDELGEKIKAMLADPKGVQAVMGIARALAGRPAVILADEPTNDLDEHWSNEIIRILKEQTEKGTAVVMVTHNSRWATEATRRCRLEDGVLQDVNN